MERKKPFLQVEGNKEIVKETKMKKLIERLIIFFIGVPVIVIIVLYLSFYNNLILNLVAIFFSGIGAVEFSSMLKKKNIHISKVESFALGALAPAAIMLNVSFNLPDWVVQVVIMTGIAWALLSRIFSKSKENENYLYMAAGSFSLLIYPGFFMYWLIKMGTWQNQYAVLLFLIIAFGNDSIAWLAGTLFGKHNRGIIPVSPNKSIAGFIGGLFGSVLIAAGAALIFPEAVFPFFKESNSLSALLLLSVIIGFFTGVAAILGDLAESAMKRSCEFKDSGSLMLGRGGVLDSIDSITVAAPVFFFLYNHFFF